VSDDKTPDHKDDIELLRQQVDAIQVAMAEKSRPWHRNPSTLLSLLALLFSFGTTMVSYVRTEAQDVQSARIELRTMLQRLAALPRESVESMKRYKDDPATIAALSGFLNQENAILARQAAEIAKKIPERYISATEYYAVGVALQNAYNVEAAKEFFTKALNVSTDINDRVGALRTRGNLLFISGQPEAGRKDYIQALDVFTGPAESIHNDYIKKSMHVTTQLAWAYAEFSINSREAALQHVGIAESYLAGLTPGPGLDLMKAQIAQTKALIFGTLPPAFPVGGMLQSGLATKPQ
jgi:tetratricopeptide (TPR) repeat protein